MEKSILWYRETKQPSFKSTNIGYIEIWIKDLRAIKYIRLKWLIELKRSIKN
jgi:hypothetical protein